MNNNCLNKESNLKFCNCSYTGCERMGLCCQCIQYHRKRNEIPACFFPEQIEKTWDRSFKNFIKTWK